MVGLSGNFWGSD